MSVHLGSLTPITSGERYALRRIERARKAIHPLDPIVSRIAIGVAITATLIMPIIATWGYLGKYDHADRGWPVGITVFCLALLIIAMVIWGAATACRHHDTQKELGEAQYAYEDVMAQELEPTIPDPLTTPQLLDMLAAQVTLGEIIKWYIDHRKKEIR